VPPLSGQLYDGIRYQGPSLGTNHVPDRPELVNSREGSLKSMGAEVVHHRQAGAPCFDIMQMEHYLQLTPDPP
jgi:hypothetical protein